MAPGAVGKRKQRPTARQRFAEAAVRVPEEEQQEEEDKGSGEDEDNEGDAAGGGLPTRPKKKRRKSKRNKKQTQAPAKQHTEEDVHRVVSEYLVNFQGGELSFKFNKRHQVLLLNSLYSVEIVPDSLFQVALDYLEGLKGGSKEVTLQEARRIVESERAEDDDDSGKDDDEDAHAARVRRTRALEVVRALS